MAELYRGLKNFLTKDLNLNDCVILDAALGNGKSTRRWAEKIDEVGGTSRIVAVDKEITDENLKKINDNLGEFKKHVKIKEGNIFSLDFLENDSIDIINCHDTIIFLNNRPLKLLFALEEFKRVLKIGGKLIITSELPPNPNKDPEAEGEWKRWTLLKMVHEMAGENFATFPRQQELKKALEVFNFEVCDKKTFPARKNTENYRLVLKETKEIIEDKIPQVPWLELRKILRQTTEEVFEDIEKDEYLKALEKIVIKTTAK